MDSGSKAARRHLRVFAVIFVGLVVVGAVVTEWLVRTRVAPEHFFYKHLALFLHDRRTDAVFGDSQMTYAFTGADGFVNLSYPGDDFANMADKIYLYFATRRPGRVIVQAGLNHFAYQYLHRVGRDDAVVAAATAMPWVRMAAPWHRRELVQYWTTWLTRGDFVSKRRFMPDGSQLEDMDYGARPVAVRRQEAARLASQWAPVRDFRTSSVALGMEALVTFLRDKGAEVCLVTTPLTPEVVEALRGYPIFEAARDFFAELAARHGIPYLDLRAAPFADNQYADRNHLNAIGARILTPMLVQQCFASAQGR